MPALFVRTSGLLAEPRPTEARRAPTREPEQGRLLIFPGNPRNEGAPMVALPALMLASSLAAVSAGLRLRLYFQEHLQKNGLGSRDEVL